MGKKRERKEERKLRRLPPETQRTVREIYAHNAAVREGRARRDNIATLRGGAWPGTAGKIVSRFFGALGK